MSEVSEAAPSRSDSQFAEQPASSFNLGVRWTEAISASIWLSTRPCVPLRTWMICSRSTSAKVLFHSKLLEVESNDDVSPERL